MINNRSIQRALRSELRRITRAEEKSFARAPGEEGERHCHRAWSRTFITLRIRDSASRTLTVGLVRGILPRNTREARLAETLLARTSGIPGLVGTRAKLALCSIYVIMKKETMERLSQNTFSTSTLFPKFYLN